MTPEKTLATQLLLEISTTPAALDSPDSNAAPAQGVPDDADAADSASTAAPVEDTALISSSEGSSAAVPVLQDGQVVEGIECRSADGLVPRKIGFDFADVYRREILLSHLPEGCRGQVRDTSKNATNALLDEGQPALLRMLAREVSLLRLDVSQAQTLVAELRLRARRDPDFDMRKLLDAERCAAVAVKRLVCVANEFSSALRPVSPTIQFSRNSFLFERNSDDAF